MDLHSDHQFSLRQLLPSGSSLIDLNTACAGGAHERDVVPVVIALEHRLLPSASARLTEPVSPFRVVFGRLMDQHRRAEGRCSQARTPTEPSASCGASTALSSSRRLSSVVRLAGRHQIPQGLGGGECDAQIGQFHLRVSCERPGRGPCEHGGPVGATIRSSTTRTAEPFADVPRVKEHVLVLERRRRDRPSPHRPRRSRLWSWLPPSHLSNSGSTWISERSSCAPAEPRRPGCLASLAWAIPLSDSARRSASRDRRRASQAPLRRAPSTCRVA